MNYNKNIKEWDLDDKNVLWVLGALHELGKMDIFESGGYELTDRGISVWDQLDSFFKPSNEDMFVVASGLLDVDVGEIILILFEFRDNRERMIEKLKEMDENDQ